MDIQSEVIYPSMLKPRGVQMTEMFGIIETILLGRMPSKIFMNIIIFGGSDKVKIRVTEVWMSTFRLCLV